MFGVGVAAQGAAALLIRLATPSAVRRRLRLARLTRRWCRGLVWLLRIDCRTEADAAAWTGAEGCLFVPNHLSYLDVVLIHATIPAVFVTSREIREVPVVGSFTALCGCLFVERRRRSDVRRDIAAIAAVLDAGVNVVVFPEGTTHAGGGLLRFKSTLLEAAVASRCRVRPVTVSYSAVDGHEYAGRIRDRVAWYGEMELLPHLWQLFRTRRIEAEVAVLPAVPFREHRSRHRLTRDVRARIEGRLALGNPDPKRRPGPERAWSR